MVVPVRTSKVASGLRRTGCRKSVGFQNFPTPHFTCWRPAVTKARW